MRDGASVTALRAVAIGIGVAACVGSREVVPLYAARPPALLGEVGFAWTSSALPAIALALAVFASVLLAESVLYRYLLRLELRSALGEALRTYTPASWLGLYLLLFLPGLGVVPMFEWWLLLDAKAWLLTLVGIAIVARKLELVPARPALRLKRPLAMLGLGMGLLALFSMWTPQRRFAEPYDERWGTGDEPRYVRIAASLLHDGDTDIENAPEHVGRRASFGHFLTRAVRWGPDALAAAAEATRAYLGSGRPGRARSLDGQIIEGRRGGLYYSFLPGFPLLLVPAMAIDSVVDPGRLVVTLVLCMLFAVVLALLLARLAETVLESVAWATALAASLALSLPLFFYFFQVYTEVPAAIAVGVILLVLLGERTSLASAASLGIACAFLPWLHGKYLPLWGAAVLAYAYRARFSRAAALGLGLAFVGLLTNCLYVFDITGSLLPDTLWTLRGYERGASLLSRSTLPGLHHVFLSREEGLFVYAPHLLLALPGLVALGKRSRFALVTCLGLLLPYVLAAASHDQGGAGAWSPPARYFVPLLPVFALALAAWLAEPRRRAGRFALLLGSASASFWMAQAMLGERNFPYDRAALLASGFLDPSPVLTSSRVGFGLLLAVGLAALLIAGRRGHLLPARAPGVLLGAVLLLGLTTSAWTRAAAWIPPQRPTAFRLRSSRPRLVQLLDCPSGGHRLRFRGTAGVHAVSMESSSSSAELRVPSGMDTELAVDAEPIRVRRREGRRDVRMLWVRLGDDERPVDVEAVCR